MTTAESERHFNIRSIGVQVSPRSEKNSVVRHHKSAIQLGKFLYCTPQVGGGEVPAVRGMSFEGIKNQRAGPCHHRLCVADREQRPDPPTFPTLTSNLDGQFEERFEDFFRAVGEFG